MLTIDGLAFAVIVLGVFVLAFYLGVRFMHYSMTALGHIPYGGGCFQCGRPVYAYAPTRAPVIYHPASMRLAEVLCEKCRDDDFPVGSGGRRLRRRRLRVLTDAEVGT